MTLPNIVAVSSPGYAILLFRERWGRILAAVGLCALILVFYGVTIRHFALVSFKEGNTFFGADSDETVESALKLDTSSGDAQKHPLFSPVVFAICTFFRAVLGVASTEAVVLTFAVLAAFNSVAAYLVLQRQSRSWVVALGFGLYYAFAFANVMMWTIPETYVVTTTIVIAYVAVLITMLDSGITIGRLAGAGLITGVAALFNPPLLLLGIPTTFVAVRSRGWKRGLTAAVSAGALSALVFLVVYLGIFRSSPIRFYSDYAQKWASLANLTSLRAVSSVVLSFSAFSIISPFDAPKAAALIEDVIGYAHSPLRLAALLGHLGAIVFAIRHLYRTRDDLSQALAVMTVGVALFYVYFNPQEAFLYSSQVVFPWTVILLRAFETQAGPAARLAAPIVLVVTALANVLSVLA